MFKTDFSFFRLLPNFSDSKKEILVNSKKIYKDFIVIHPKERYLQITNSQIDIIFNSSYKVEVIDCEENILIDITENVFINEFQDIHGIYQIAFEILPLNIDYSYKNVFLKFTHTAGTEVFYSNPILITSDNELDTIRLDYKSYNYNNGISYDRANFYQSVRLVGYKNGKISVQDGSLYTQLNGIVRKSRIIQSYDTLFNIDFIDDFTSERLQNALNSDVCYINGVRAITKDELKIGERKSRSNLYDASFTSQLNENDTYNYVNQISPIFNFIELEPLGIYSLETISIIGEIIFNYYITGFESLKLYNYDTDALIQEITSYVIIGNSIQFSMPILPNGNYYFKILNVSNNYNEKINITDKDVWKFTIQDGDFLGADFEPNDFLIY